MMFRTERNRRPLNLISCYKSLRSIFLIAGFIFGGFSILANTDTDGDGISDALDSLPNQKSGVAISLTETDSIVTYNGDVSSDYPNLTFSQSERKGRYG